MPSTSHMLALLILWSRSHLMSIILERKWKLRLNNVKSLIQGHTDSRRWDAGPNAPVPDPMFPQITPSLLPLTWCHFTYRLYYPLLHVITENIIFNEKLHF